MFKILSHIIQHRGIRGLYRGFAVNANKDFMSCGTYFLIYNNLKEFGITHEINSLAYSMFIGGASSN